MSQAARGQDATHQVAPQHQDGARIVCGAAVVSGGEDGDELPRGEALEAVHDALMRPDNHLRREAMLSGESGEAALHTPAASWRRRTP